MILSTVFLAASLLVILICAETFTNGLEVFGRRFSFSQAVVGNLLAAVGTALPETILPFVAILFTRGGSSKDIGVGAILGAPFMISTLAFFLVGLTIFIGHMKKIRPFEINIEPEPVKRDLAFFVPMYAMAVFVPLFTGRSFVIPIVAVLLAGYAFYVYLTIKGKSAGIEHFEELHIFKLQKKLGIAAQNAPHTVLILLQVVMALIVMVLGVRVFIHNLEYLSLKLGMSPMIFALMIAPIATELPEKFNSITWILKGKDALAIGNLTGAMVFQSTFPVAIGLLFTEWRISGMALISAVIALASGIILLAAIYAKKRVSPWILFLGGVFYLLYVVMLFLNIK